MPDYPTEGLVLGDAPVELSELTTAPVAPTGDEVAR
jgi:hypothetical protein